MSTRARRLASPLGVAALALAATLAVHLRDPHVPGAWGACPTRLLTGLDCPLCGGLRAVNDLTHLELGAALSSNLLVVLAVPVVLVLWGRRVAACWRGGAAMRPLTPPAWLWAAGLVAVAAYTIARNVPGSWLAA